MARNRYPGYCYRCGKWCPPGTAHFERHEGHWRVHCIECAKENQRERNRRKQRRKRQRKKNDGDVPGL